LTVEDKTISGSNHETWYLLHDSILKIKIENLSVRYSLTIIYGLLIPGARNSCWNLQPDSIRLDDQINSSGISKLLIMKKEKGKD